MERVFVVVPVFNEEATLEGVLAQLEQVLTGPNQGRNIQEVILVDDGSTDGSGRIIDAWVKVHKGFVALHHPANRGYSQALLTGFGHLVQRMAAGELRSSDIIATVDADGQHDPLDLPRLVDIMEREQLDVLWGQRDFTLYPLFKRVGNRLMSIMATVVSGHPFRDVESGYCLFRLGPLAYALRIRSRDWRYSISLTLAVILARLGYKISNQPKVMVPLYRSRTRILDVFTDTLAALSGFWDVQRETLRSPKDRVFLAIGAVTALSALVMLALIAVKSIYLGYDSINNYVHVWSIASAWKDGQVPLRVPWLEGGQGLAYPYGYFPWTLSAALFLALGDIAVTWVGALGFVLLLAVVWQTRLRNRPWLFTLFLLFPPVLESLLSFQVAFIWGCLFAFLYVHALEVRSRWLAPLWLVLAVSSNILIIGPVLLVYDLAAWIIRPEQRSGILRSGLIALPLLLAVAWYTLQTPSVGFYPPWFLAFTITITLVPRAAMFLLPFLLSAKRRFFGKALPGVAVAVLFIGLFSVQLIPFTSFPGLVARADNVYAPYLEGPAFAAGATYRLLEPNTREQGSYFFVQKRAVLAQELFSESQLRRNWTMPAYRCVLNSKGVDYVVLNRGFTPEFQTNEEELLETMTDLTLATIAYVDPAGHFKVYDVRPAREQQRLPVRQCNGL